MILKNIYIYIYIYIFFLQKWCFPTPPHKQVWIVSSITGAHTLTAIDEQCGLGMCIGLLGQVFVNGPIECIGKS